MCERTYSQKYYASISSINSVPEENNFTLKLNMSHIDRCIIETYFTLFEGLSSFTIKCTHWEIKF